MPGHPKNRRSRSAAGYNRYHYLSFGMANATEIFFLNNNGLMVLYLIVG